MSDYEHVKIAAPLTMDQMADALERVLGVSGEPTEDRGETFFELPGRVSCWLSERKRDFGTGIPFNRDLMIGVTWKKADISTQQAATRRVYAQLAGTTNWGLALLLSDEDDLTEIRLAPLPTATASA